MKRYLTAVLVFFFLLASEAANKTWSNTAGDWDIGNIVNWGGTYPSLTADLAKLNTETTAAQPYVLVATNLFESWQISLDQPMTIDLGAGGKLIAKNKFLFAAYGDITLKRGTMGVDWEGASSERFFLGDNRTSTGDAPSSLTVDGPQAKLTGAKKSTIQVGTNRSNIKLCVKNGATVEGNMIVGQNATATNNLAWFEGAGTRHIVPEGGTVEGLIVGNAGTDSRYVLTNGASFYCPALAANKCVLVGNGSANNRLEVMDHSTFKTMAPLYIGNSGAGTNTMVVAGGSKAVFEGVLYVGNRLGGSRNQLLVLDGATLEPKSSLVIGGGNSGASAVESELVISNATVDASATELNISQHALGRDNRVLVQDGGCLIMTNSTIKRFWVGNNGVANRMDVIDGKVLLSNRVFYVGNEANSVSNVLRISGGVFSVTNEANPSSWTSAIGQSGGDCRMIVENGARVEWNDTYPRNSGAVFTIGTASTAENCTLIVTNKSKWVQRSYASGTAPSWVIGLEGANAGFLLDDSELDLCSERLTGQIINVGQKAAASNSWMKVRNGAKLTTHRIMVGNAAKNCSLEVDDATCYMGQFQFGDVAASGTQFTISGDKTKIDATSLTLAPGMTMTYRIDGRGLRTDDAVMTITNDVKATSSKVSASDPVTIKIDTLTDAKPGTYTLMEVTGSKKTIDWTNVNLEYDASRIEIVEQTTTKLKVRVRPVGLILLFK